MSPSPCRRPCQVAEVIALSARLQSGLGWVWGIAATALLLSLASAPFEQWYLAWIALAPLLIVIGRATCTQVAFLRGWLAGVFYFALNLWWLWTATIPGTIALVLYYGLYWALASAAIYRLQLPSPAEGMEDSASVTSSGMSTLARIVAVASLWTIFEWLRCNAVATSTWLPLGSTQVPLVIMCQVADLGGTWMVGFWVVAANVAVAIAWVRRKSIRESAVPLAIGAALLLLVGIYGASRLATTRTRPGPRVTVIQSNVRHLPGGAISAEPQEVVRFFLASLKEYLSRHSTDLVVMPEAAFPPLNEEARRALARSPVGPFLDTTYQQLLEIARKHRTGLVLGGNAVTGWTLEGTARVGTEIRNSVYYFDPQGEQVVSRYDKAHLVPFSERAPFATGPEWIRRVALFVAASRAAQPLTAGSLSALHPFVIQWSTPPADRQSPPEGGEAMFKRAGATASFIAPVCLENVDPRVVAQMVRKLAAQGSPPDFIANLSNDGWFAAQEKHQHLQLVALRCIEHRVPMVRSSNTGISGFIDSTGRVQKALPPHAVGALTNRIALDGRQTIYSSYGDWFVLACAALVGVWAVSRQRLSR